MKILTLDIETSPHLSAHWRRWQENIPPEFTLEESEIIMFAAKWYDKKTIFSRNIWDDGKESLLEELWRLMDEADLIVSYNGKRFDLKRINTEFLIHKFTPPSGYHQVDLFQQAKKHFKFSSNKLKHVLRELGLGSKMEDNVDMQLWIDACFLGVIDAQSHMIKYCKQDVKVTESLYDYMLGWIQPHHNWGLYLDDGTDNPVCPNCGSYNLIRKGWQHTKVRTYQRWKCNDCGAHHRGRKNVAKPGRDNGVLS